LPNCKFTTLYHDYEIGDEIHFCCPEEPLASGFCIFHDKDYLRRKTKYEEHKMKVLDKFKHKVNYALFNNEPLYCIGFYLPDFSLSDLSIYKDFTKPVYFSDSQFFGKADFSKANFQDAAFSRSIFQREALFKEANFAGEAFFNRAKFQ
jgi:hypothetical protein